MSLNKSATRRLSLMTASSLVAASFAAFAGVALAPTAALAANECGNPSDNGATADTLVCTGVIPSIAYPATNGNLTLRLQGPLTVTGGITVTPTGSNTVTINRLADDTPGAGDPQVSNGAGAAINIERATGGTVNLTLNDTDSGGNGDLPAIALTGTTAGIRIRNAGTGSTTVTVGASAADANLATVTATDGAAIDVATSGTGNITINTGAVVTGGTAAISVTSGNNVTITQGANAPGHAIGGTFNGRLLLANTGNTTVNIGGEWYFDGTSTLRDASVLTGSATLTNDRVIASIGASAAIDFGSGTGTFNQRGYLAAGDESGAATLTLRGVDTWTNTGTLIFGMGELLQSDAESNDRIVLVNDTAATFTGQDLSLLVMDVDFTASQDSCAAAVTADCFDLRGHNTAGVTAVAVNPVAFGFTAERIVLVDVAGAGSDDGVFRLSEQSTGYRALGDGMVDTGLFLYELVHDDTAQQHVLMVGGVDSEGVELNLAGRAAFTAWDTATGAWFGRQADLRNALADGTGSAGGWVRLAGSFANQDMVSTHEIGGTTVDVITSHTQDTAAFVGGIDLVGAVDGGNAWVVGLTAGKVNSEFGFDESPNGFEFDGYMMGAYASYLSPGFFVDGVVNALRTDAAYALPSVGLNLEGDATSLGYRIEGGLRWDWGDGVLFEPMATLSYVTTDLGSLPIAPGVSADFDSVSDFRGALGARLSGDVAFNDFTVRLAGLGRVWQSVNGDTSSAIATPFGDFGFIDETDGTLGEVGLSVGLFDAGGRFSIQANSGVKFREKYQNVDVSIGARYQW